MAIATPIGKHHDPQDISPNLGVAIAIYTKQAQPGNSLWPFWDG